MNWATAVKSTFPAVCTIGNTRSSLMTLFSLMKRPNYWPKQAEHGLLFLISSAIVFHWMKQKQAIQKIYISFFCNLSVMQGQCHCFAWSTGNHEAKCMPGSKAGWVFLRERENVAENDGGKWRLQLFVFSMPLSLILLPVIFHACTLLSPGLYLCSNQAQLWNWDKLDAEIVRSCQSVNTYFISFSMQKRQQVNH